MFAGVNPTWGGLSGSGSFGPPYRRCEAAIFGHAHTGQESQTATDRHDCFLELAPMRSGCPRIDEEGSARPNPAQIAPERKWRLPRDFVTWFVT